MAVITDTVLLQIRVGMSIGHSADVPQYEPDVRQKEHEISQEEKEEADRRIVG